MESNRKDRIQIAMSNSLINKLMNCFDNTLIEKLIDLGLLRNKAICSICGATSTIINNKSKVLVGYRWRCSNLICKKENSIITDSIYQQHYKWTLNEVTLMLLCFSYYKMNSVFTTKYLEDLIPNFTYKQESIASLFQELRKMIAFYYDSLYEYDRMGDLEEAFTVAVDESHFTGKRKNSGQRWVFGAISTQKQDNQKREIRLYAIGDRTQETLSKCIGASIKENATIISDGWRSYNYLDNEGSEYTHIQHIHGQYDFGEGEESTSYIEQLWSKLKRSIISIYNTIPSGDFYLFLKEAEFRYYQDNSDMEASLRELSTIIKYYYDINC